MLVAALLLAHRQWRQRNFTAGHRIELNLCGVGGPSVFSSPSDKGVFAAAWLKTRTCTDALASLQHKQIKSVMQKASTSHSSTHYSAEKQGGAEAGLRSGFLFASGPDCFILQKTKKKYTLYDIALVCPVNLNPISAASILVHGHTCGRWWNEIEHSTIIFIGFYVTRWEESEWLEWRRCLCGYFCGGLCFRSFCYIVMPRFVSCPPSPGKQNVFDLDYRSDLRVLDTIVSTEFDECDTVKRWFLPAETLIQYWERVQRLNNKHQVEKVFSWQHGCETEKE